MTEEISDLDIILAEFLGSDFAQSVRFEVGQEIIERIYLAGFSAAQAMEIARLDRLIEYQEEARK